MINRLKVTHNIKLFLFIMSNKNYMGLYIVRMVDVSNILHCIKK